MAILNGLYIHVTEESVSNQVESTSHPVEQGLELTDSVRRKPVEVSLSGKIVDYDSKKASQVLGKLKSWQATGALVDYAGRNSLHGYQIVALDTSHPNTNWGGLDFDMTLKQVRIAASSYVPKPVVTPPKVEEAQKNPVLEEGATVIFKGGGVYVSSDAGTPAATGGRSTCTLTILSTAGYSTHPYHLISQDGGGIYGWVDRNTLEGMPENQANSVTNGGTQQIKTG